MQYPGDFSRARPVTSGRIAFSMHLTVYVLVNALLLGINLGTSTAHLWVKWPLMGWGIGILAHALVTFVLPRTRMTNRRTNRRLLREELRKRASKSL